MTQKLLLRSVSLLSFLSGIPASSLLRRIQVEPNTQHFVEELGRVRISHGVDVVYKLPPFLPYLTYFDQQKLLTDDNLSNLSKWGFNMIRLYTARMGVNAQSSDKVDQNYLSQLSTAASMMGNRGIYALLDYH